MYFYPGKRHTYSRTFNRVRREAFLSRQLPLFGESLTWGLTFVESSDYSGEKVTVTVTRNLRCKTAPNCTFKGA